jgi:hypothetical protein
MGGGGEFQEANYLLLLIITSFSAFSVLYMPNNIQQYST